MSTYEYFKSRIENLSNKKDNIKNISLDIEQAYQDGMLLGTDYDSLMDSIYIIRKEGDT